MAVPKFHEFMLPILRHLTDGEPRHWRELRENCVVEFGLSDDDRAEATPGGRPRLDNRVLWANTYLFQAGLVHRPRRGQVQISNRGQKVLLDPPSTIDLDYLERFPEYQEFRSRTRQQQDGDEPAADTD